MYLGLDLRGGVHFMLQVDMQAALTKKAESLAGDLRSVLREKNVRHAGIERATARPSRCASATRGAGGRAARAGRPVPRPAGGGIRRRATTTRLAGDHQAGSGAQVQDQALKQNMVTLHNRINELGVAEPVIQQQGADRIVVQLPGVQDTAKAKDILGRTATLEVRMVDESTEGPRRRSGAGPVPVRRRALPRPRRRAVIVKRQVVLTGENLTDAQAGFDNQTQEPAVHLTLDAKGARIFRDVTRENVGKRMAILLFEKGKGEVVTAPVIRSEIGGGRVQISGRMTTAEANDIALLLRAGSLAAPMEIIEEMTIGPSLGAENIAKGFNSVAWGFAAIAPSWASTTCCSACSRLALAVNLLLLVAILSMLQATLTLPGMAAIALALGMADRFQRADQRAGARGAARRRLAAGGDQHRLRPRLGDHPGLERDHPDRRRGAAGLRLRAGARLRGGPLPRHPDLDVLGGVLLARPGEPLVRPPEEAEVGVHRTGLAARRRWRYNQGRVRTLPGA